MCVCVCENTDGRIEVSHIFHCADFHETQQRLGAHLWPCPVSNFTKLGCVVSKMGTEIPFTPASKAGLLLHRFS